MFGSQCGTPPPSAPTTTSTSCDAPRPSAGIRASDTFDDFSQHVRSMLDAMSGEQFFRSHAHGGWRPRINVYELPDRYYVCAELAGMPHEKIDLRIEDGQLHLRGVRPKPALPRGGAEVSVHLMEIDSGPFERTLGLPRDVDADRIAARYRDGFLWIELPRQSPTEDNDE